MGLYRRAEVGVTPSGITPLVVFDVESIGHYLVDVRVSVSSLDCNERNIVLL